VVEALVAQERMLMQSVAVVVLVGILKKLFFLRQEHIQ
jgi:hypothetical protein